MEEKRVHDIRYIEDKGMVKALCACKAGSGWVGLGEAQEWHYRHDRLVQQAMVHLRGNAPTLKNQHDYYQSKADDPQETRQNRDLWQQLADELRPRVPVTKAQSTEHDEQLPFDVKYTPRYRGRDQP